MNIMQDKFIEFRLISSTKRGSVGNLYLCTYVYDCTNVEVWALPLPMYIYL